MSECVQTAASRWLEFLDASQKDSPEAAEQWVLTKGRERRKRPKSLPYTRREDEKLATAFRFWQRDGAEYCPVVEQADDPSLCELIHNPNCCVFCAFMRMNG
jgi:hypothetical protein